MSLPAMPTKPLFNTVADLLPHRPPMLLIDKVLAWDDSYLEAIVEHTSPNIFTDANGNVPAWVGIEYMAQAVGAWVGIQSLEKGGSVRIGFLLGTHKYLSFCDHFSEAETLLVRVDKLMLDQDNLGLFDCSISSDKVLAKAQIKAIQPPNVDNLLKEQQLREIK
jgi:predicted hotdog family 3-hydroxylacyl-ACP dehydratase